jgi:phosphoribosyl 1,2-cyclic phosphodiesterase
VGNTPCVQITGDDGGELILDAGSGIRGLGVDLFGRCRRLDILLTHLHLDHIQGLLFFAPLFDPEVEITVWGPPGRVPLRKRLARYLSTPLSPVEIRDLPAKVAFEEVPSNGMAARRVPRAGGAGRPSRTHARLPDRAFRRQPLLPARPRARTRHEPALDAGGLDLRARAARGATALIHDSQYSDRRIRVPPRLGSLGPQRHLAFAQRAQPESLLLFHHDPSHATRGCNRSDVRRASVSAGLQLDSRIELAREGRVLDL